MNSDGVAENAGETVLYSIKKCKQVRVYQFEQAYKNAECL